MAKATSSWRVPSTLRSILTGLVLGLAVAAGPAATAQYNEPGLPNAKAVEAFEQMLKAYRAHPALIVRSTLKIELTQGETTADGGSKTAEITWVRPAAGGPPSGIVKLNDYVCTFHENMLNVVHVNEDRSYYREAFEGSPYWPLLIDFQDIPYPHLALFWGEAAPVEVWMQLFPQSPGIVPTSVETMTVKGQPRQRLRMESPDAVVDMTINPTSRLIERIDHDITGGAFVPMGTRRRTTYTFDYTRHDKPLPATTFAFDPGDREPVDLLASLRPAPAPMDPAAGADLAAGMRPQGLVGKAAPGFVLATADGGAIDLEDHRGRVVVLDFWATWCGPCRRALPHLHEVAKWARDEALPVDVVTINVWEGRDPAKDTPDARLASARAFWEKSGFTLPVAMDYTDEVAAAYGVRGIPATFVIRSDGVVHAQPPADPGLIREAIEGALAALEAPAGGAP